MMNDEVTRREALRRAAYVLGGALSAPTVAAVLAACERGAPASGGAGPAGATAAAAYAPRTLTPPQSELVATLADHIIPATDTPGARAAGVHEFIDAMLTDFYPAEERQRFLAGLARVDTRAERAHGKAFLALTPAQQGEMVAELDRLAFLKEEQHAAQSGRQDPVVAPEKSAASSQGDVAAGRGVGQNAATAAGAVQGANAADLEETGKSAFFRRLKELTLVGYYTSRVGSLQELRVNPMGAWRADVAYAPTTPSWA